MVITEISKPIQGEGTRASDYAVLIETSGERFVGVLPREVVTVVRVNAPDSGEAGRLDRESRRG